MITHDGVTRSVADWAVSIGIRPRSLYRRLRQWPLALALTRPRRQPAALRPNRKPRLRAPEMTERGTFVCIRCLNEKPPSEFTLDPHNWRGYRSDCRACNTEMQKRHRDKRSPETVNARRVYMRTYMRLHQHKYRKNRNAYYRQRRLDRAGQEPQVNPD